MTITIPFWIIPVAGFICGVIGAMTFDLLNRKKKCNHTALIDKDQVKAEIKRRYAEYSAKARTNDPTYYAGMADALDLFDQYVDTLPEQPDSEEKFRNLLDAMGDCGFSQDNILLLKSIWEDADGADKKGIPEQPELKPMNIPSAGGGMSTTPPSYKLDVKPEHPELPGIEKEGIPGKDFIPVEWVDACERYGKWKIVQKVKSASEDLEKDFEKEIDKTVNECTNGYDFDWEKFARHFYELGCRRTAVMYDDIEWERQKREEQPVEGLEEEIDRFCESMWESLPNFDHSDGDAVISVVKNAARHFAEWGAEHLKR